MARSQPLKDHWKEQRLFFSRVIGAAVVVLLMSGLLVLRLVQLQIVDYQQFSERARNNQVRIEFLPPTRGLVYDSSGELLVDNVPTWQLVALPEKVGDVEATLTELESWQLLDPVNHELLVERIRSHRQFEPVTLGNLTEAQAAQFAVRRHRLSGVDIQAGLVRFYHDAEAIAHAVGYVSSISTADLQKIDRDAYAGTSQIGKTGIERAYEERLHGTTGSRQQVVNAQGRVMLDPVDEAGEEQRSGVYSGLETRWPVPGNDLVLSLDVGLQRAAYTALKDFRGAAVAIDPRNGDVLVLVSTPSFDLNRFAEGLSGAEFADLNSDLDQPLFNRALAGRYAPGSTVKPFLGLAGLHYDTDFVHDDHFCAGEFRLDGSSHRYREGRGGSHGEMDLHMAIVRSCNVYFYGLAEQLDIDRMSEFMTRFGFGSRTRIDISGEVAGIMPSREWKRANHSTRENQIWYPGETINVGIGQGAMAVTPIQLAHATAAIAANGRRFRPRLLVGVRNGETGETIPIAPEELTPIDDVDHEHWLQVQDAMLSVTTNPRGTGYTSMQGSTYSVAGKTGTAQERSIGQDERYDEEALAERDRDNGLFIAYAPAEAPTIAIAVVVENNGGGSRTAAPVARRVLDAYFGTEEYVAKLAPF